MICSQCGNSLAEGSKSCPRCGAAVAGHGSTAAGPGGTPGGAQAFSFDAARWSQAERITGVATVVLLISLFLPWFSINFGGIVATASGTTAHGFLWLVFFVSLAIIAFLVLQAGFQTLPFTMPLGREVALLAAAALNLLLVLIAFFDNPYAFSGVGWTFGAFVALVAAVVACLPLGVPVVRARLARN
jgi:hypothetical protein